MLEKGRGLSRKGFDQPLRRAAGREGAGNEDYEKELARHRKKYRV